MIQAYCIRFRRWLRIPAKYGGWWNPWPKDDVTIPWHVRRYLFPYITQDEYDRLRRLSALDKPKE